MKVVKITIENRKDLWDLLKKVISALLYGDSITITNKKLDVDKYVNIIMDTGTYNPDVSKYW